MVSLGLDSFQFSQIGLHAPKKNAGKQSTLSYFQANTELCLYFFFTKALQCFKFCTEFGESHSPKIFNLLSNK
jgi:hypothetical protein